MKGLILGLLVALATLSPAAGVHAQSQPQFQLGFKALADQIPDIVGRPLENEHYAANGDSLQTTTNGLMVWRKADNWTAFTNGSWTWINGPAGIQDRANGDRFQWELATQSPVQSTFNLDDQVETQYYDVQGETAAQLVPQLVSSPCGTGDWGCTLWNYTVTYSQRPDGSISVPPGAPYYHIRVLLPRWTPPGSASPDLVASWQRMVAALETHEKKHVDIAITGLAAMRSAIEGAHSLEEAASISKAAEQRIEQDEVTYDQVSNHGKNEGITFP